MAATRAAAARATATRATVARAMAARVTWRAEQWAGTAARRAEQRHVRRHGGLGYVRYGDTAGGAAAGT
eukprot:CAMPEP_0118831222 /NCGR_PEP_ID=MMETSP1162-20130426/29853_1 /TAXON_ID=33656 /ORGANISM="Phaeocystis Sp, Strain CCMP2710" /LENGTH=68 /DNA_ID=CAMNT_0006762617 /DNA_START=294 /DNA_END=496 /DNA_ORIENTATION=-